MASVKSTFYSLLTLAMLLGLVAGGVYGWQRWQQYQMAQVLGRAQALLHDGQALQADRLLDERLRQAHPSAAWVPAAVALRLEALRQAGDLAAQEVLARQVLQAPRPWVRPGQEGWARAQMAVGEAALQAGQAEAARQAFAAILAQPAAPWGRDEARFGLAKVKLATPSQFLEGKQDLEALSTRLPPADPLRLRVESLLGDVNLRLLLHPQPQEGDQLYVLAPHDTIASISKRFKVSPDLLMRVNAVTDPKRLTIGRRMKIPNLDLSIVVDKTDNTLTLLNKGKFFKRYRVRTGTHDFQTPVGEYRIGHKVETPAWTHPGTRQHFGPGEPGNELGARWMGFQGNETLGIHEAVDPRTVGTYGSNGCIGLAQHDILELYDLVRVGTPVTITGERPPTEAIAIAPTGTPTAPSPPLPEATVAGTPAPSQP
jgi:lipoprotein-anchoring transpeptidase ErfK/SrfK/predicted negative regulator of RcsB-dependent stress response